MLAFLKALSFWGRGAVRAFMTKKKWSQTVLIYVWGGKGRRGIANKKPEKCPSAISPPYPAVSFFLFPILDLNHSPIFPI